MTEREIYLVVGATGEGPDHHEWPVVAYDDLEAAEAHVVKLHEALGGEWARPHDRHSLSRDVRESGLDPRCNVDYTGAAYTVEAVTLRLASPKAPPGPRSRPSDLAQ